MSRTVLYNYKQIGEKLLPEFVEAVDENVIPFKSAEILSRLPEEKQKEVLENVDDLSNLSIENTKAIYNDYKEEVEKEKNKTKGKGADEKDEGCIISKIEFEEIREVIDSLQNNITSQHNITLSKTEHSKYLKLKGVLLKTIADIELLFQKY